jgi:hypothetical protein
MVKKAWLHISISLNDKLVLYPNIYNHMSVTDLLPNLQKLSRTDKFLVMQFLVSDLSKGEGIENLSDTFQSGAIYPVWSPYDSHQAAHQLMQLLEEDRLVEKDNHA